MRESKLYKIFKDKIKKADPNCFWYKIPDTFNLGGKKPFDGFLVIKDKNGNGVPFAIEFKSAKGILTRYQAYQLVDFTNAGGEAMIYQEGKTYMDKFIEEILEKAKEKC